MQLFGSDPEILSEAARWIEDRPFDILDFNMGCPTAKIVKRGEGSALMKNPKLAGKIISALVKAVKKPITVKIRRGFDEEHVNAVEISKIVEQAGASAIAIHGRTREQYYSGKADWEIIRRVKEAVSIPVIGNGDVNSQEKAKEMLEETGCDGIMIGRGAQGIPWIFSRIIHYIETGEILPGPSKDQICEMILRHARMLLNYKGEYKGIQEMKKHVAWYTAGFPYSAKFRSRVNEIQSMEELKYILKELQGTFRKK